MGGASGICHPRATIARITRKVLFLLHLAAHRLTMEGFLL